MRWLAKLLLPILIVLGWLPSNLSAQQRAELKGEPSVEHKQTAAQHLAPATQPTLSEKQIAQATPDQNDSKTPTPQPDNDSGKPHDSAWWFNALLVVFSGVLAIVGIIQSFILCYTYQTSRLALKADRPYLLVEKASLEGFDDKKVGTGPEVHFTFKNFGKRPALIDRIVLRLDHVETGKYPAKGDFSLCAEKPFVVYAIAAGDIFEVATDPNQGWAGVLRDEDIREGKRVLICFGCICYSDVIGNDPHETGFLWYYHPHPPAFLQMAELFTGQPRKYKGRFLPARTFYHRT